MHLTLLFRKKNLTHIKMPIQSPISFLSAHLDSRQCELFNDGANKEIVAYIPNREHWEAMIGLNTSSYIDGEVKARAMGLESNWN